MKCSFCTWAVKNLLKQRRSHGISNGVVVLRNFGRFFLKILNLLLTVTPAYYFSRGHIKDTFPRRNNQKNTNERYLTNSL